jgi:RNA polymerase sigma-70 factor, ECF subfamily
MTCQMHRDVIDTLPHLRAFAQMLARDRALADDLVQEAVVRALTHADQFEAGTNFKAWITTILRNSYFNEVRHRGQVSGLAAIAPREEPATSGGQEEKLEFRDFERAFQTLPAAQREALLLVGASGFSYNDAADIVGCAVGTMKSRVARARSHLGHTLHDDLGSPASRRMDEDEAEHEAYEPGCFARETRSRHDAAATHCSAR